MRRSLRDLLDWHSTHHSVTSKFKVVELKQITFEALKQSAKDTRYKRWNTIHRIHNIRWKIKPVNNHIQNVPHCSSTRKIDVWLYGLKLRSHYALTWAVEERKRAYCAFALLIRLTGPFPECTASFLSSLSFDMLDLDTDVPRICDLSLYSFLGPHLLDPSLSRGWLCESANRLEHLG